MNWQMLLFLTLAVITTACQQAPVPGETPPEPPQAAQCSTDSECATGGCSGQVCTTANEASDIITTCEYREEYGCLKLTSCGCVEGRCAWRENSEYSKCLDEAKPQPRS